MLKSLDIPVSNDVSPRFSETRPTNAAGRERCMSLSAYWECWRGIPTANHVSARLADRIAYKRCKTTCSDVKYRDFSLILGSVAIIERLGSIAGKILTDHRKEITPIVFEALLFLRMNVDYWNVPTVKEVGLRECSLFKCSHRHVPGIKTKTVFMRDGRKSLTKKQSSKGKDD